MNFWIIWLITILLAAAFTQIVFKWISKYDPPKTKQDINSFYAIIMPIAGIIMLIPFVNFIIAIYVFVLMAKDDGGKHEDFWEGTWILTLGIGVAWCFGFKEDLERVINKPKK